jgi:hypothetical protein
MPAIVDITVENDADFYQLFQYTLVDGVTPVSLVGASFVMGVRRTAQDAAALFYVSSTASAAGQITLWDAPNGKFAILIAKAILQRSPIGIFQQSLVCNLPAQGGQPAVSQKIWGGTLTNNPGPSR